MPNYVYRCVGCAEEVTRQVPIAERDTTFECDCGNRFHRQPFAVAPGTSFKGGGWTPKFHG